MPVVANRAFKFAGRDIDAGAEVVGENGERPEGRVFSRLIRTGKISVVDRDTAETVPAAGNRTENARVRRVQKGA